LTSPRATLLDVISSEAGNPDLGAAMETPSTESYIQLVPLFASITEDYQIFDYLKMTPHPPSEINNVSTLVDMDPDNEFLISPCLKYGRCIRGFLHTLLLLLQKK